MEEYYNNSSSENIESGFVAKVTIEENTVTMEPTGILPFEMNHKMENQKIFNDLVKDIPGLNQPQILEEDSSRGIYKVERAKGVPLSTIENDNKDNIFFRISTKEKIKALYTYLETIDTLNDEGYIFRDHKSDSIFITRNGKIAIVDAGSIEKTLSFQDKESLFQTERGVPLSSKKSSQFENVLKSFFTRGLQESAFARGLQDPSNEIETLIPPTIRVLIEKCEKREIKDIETLKNLVKRYIDGENILNIDIPKNPIVSVINKSKLYNIEEEMKPYLVSINKDPQYQTLIGQDILSTFMNKLYIRKHSKFKFK